MARPESMAGVLCLVAIIATTNLAQARFNTFGHVASFEKNLNLEVPQDIPPATQAQPNEFKPSVDSTTGGEAAGAGSWPKEFPAEVLHGHEQDLERVQLLHSIVSKIAINNTVIVVPANMGFLNLALNLRCRLIDLGSTNLLVWALDKEASQKLEEMSIPHFYDPTLYSVSGPVGYGLNQVEYSRMMSERPRVWWRILATGYDMLFLDADVVAFDLPEHAVERVADVEGQLDYQPRYGWDFHGMSNASTICAGVFWIRSAAKTLAWMDAVTHSFEEQSPEKDEVFKRYGHWDDQIALNYLMHNSAKSGILNPQLVGERRADTAPESVNVLYMHPAKLLGGDMLAEKVTVAGKGYSADFLYDVNGQVTKFRPAVIHFNGRGKQAKEECMKENGWWEIDESLKCISTKGSVSA